MLGLLLTGAIVVGPAIGEVGCPLSPEEVVELFITINESSNFSSTSSELEEIDLDGELLSDGVAATIDKLGFSSNSLLLFVELLLLSWLFSEDAAVDVVAVGDGVAILSVTIDKLGFSDWETITGTVP